MTPETQPAAPGLLIALTGKPGEGRTSTLLALAAHQHFLQQRVEGFVALAGRRGDQLEGAEEYRLRLLPSNEEFAWARRDRTLSPPYRFEPEAVARLQGWAAALAPEAPLVIMDEFSKIEAAGGGLMAIWPAVAAARPHIVVLAVREGFEEAIEERLGRKFDLRVAARSPDAAAQLQRACADYGEWTRVGLFGGAAGGIELTLGTFLHVSKIPLRGLALCSLQGALMTFTGFGLSRPGRVVWVPFISAGLKALAPGGSRLRPMLAITMQGALYGLAVQALGWNLAGVTLGGALIGAWAASQGFFLQYLMLGGELIRAYDATVRWLAEHWQLTAPSLPWLIGAWTLLHALVAAGVAFTAWRLRAPPRALQELIRRETERAPVVAGGPVVPRWRRIAREFARWHFWLPLAIVAVIALASGRSWETAGWLVLRFVAVGFVLISLASLVRPGRLAEKLRRMGWWGPAVAFRGATARRVPRE